MDEINSLFPLVFFLSGIVSVTMSATFFKDRQVARDSLFKHLLLVLLMVLGIFIFPVAVGVSVGLTAREPELSFKIFVGILCFFCALVASYTWWLFVAVTAADAIDNETRVVRRILGWKKEVK